VDGRTTDRLRADRPTPADRDDYVAGLGDPRLAAWLWPPPLEPPDLDAWLRRDIERWERYGFGTWVLRDRATGAFVGRAGLARTEDAVELAWTIVPDRWGEGLATEAARAAVDYARELGLAELVAFTLPANAASEGVMRKLGMEPAGAIEHAGLPHVLYRLRL
jgi:RimJ/RimL family protein N-acetyltransferase